jgi:hypothetical protein
MAAKFGDIGFDFGGTYTEVMLEDSFTYKLSDDREVSVALALLRKKGTPSYRWFLMPNLKTR